MGPLGSGKTTASIQKILELMCQQRPNKQGERRSRWVAVRNSYPDLFSTTIRDWRAITDPLKIGTMTMGHPPEIKCDFDLPDGTRVLSEGIFHALDDDEDVRKLRGMQLTFAYLNEMKELPKSIFDMALGRVDRYPMQGASSWVGVFGDTNAWDQDHWLETIAEGKRKGGYADYEILVQPGGVVKRDGVWEINPDRENRVFIGPEYYRRQIEGKREDWVHVNLANNIGYAIDGKAVHPDYSDILHSAKEPLVPTANRACHVGLDFGLTPAAAFLQRQADGRWWVFDELPMEDGDAAMLAEELKARVAQWNAKVPGLTWVFRGDRSGDERAQSDSGTPFAVLRAHGVYALPASSNDPVLRRAALDRPLTRLIHGRPGILISPVCNVIRKGLSGAFHYKRVAIAGKESLYRDVPNKTFHSHICEALEYGLMDAGEHAVINPGLNDPMMKPAIRPRSSWSPLDV